MNRRGFLGMLGAAVAAPVLVKSAPPKVVEYATNTTPPVPVERATWCRYIVGVAMSTVSVGDLVQIQTAGPSHVQMTT